MGDAPTPPTVPDPNVTAQAQYGANVQSGLANSILGNPNVTNPFGSVNYTPGASTNIGGFDIPRYNENVTLSPTQQTLYNQQTALGSQENQLAGTAMTNAANILGTPITTAPNLQTSLPGVGQLRSSIPTTPLQNQIAGAGPLQKTMGPTDFTQDVNATTAAVQARLQPQLQIQQQALQAQLANQGVTPGSQAYETAMDQFGRQVNDANTQALLAGEQEQQTLFGEALQQGGFANQAQQQQFNQNAAQQQVWNQAQGQQFNQGQTNAELWNQAQAQQFNQNQNQAAFGNQAQLQQLGAQMSLRDAPLNEISTLLHGGQVTAPQFTAYQPGQIAAAPIATSTYQAGLLNNQLYGTQMNAYGQEMGGLFGLGGALAGAAGNYFGLSGGLGAGGGSDRRIKRDIVRIGRWTKDLPAYSFRYLWSDDVQVGVMADEVLQVMPEAVHANDDGILFVDYDMLDRAA